jgi:hypothetical protein
MKEMRYMDKKDGKIAIQIPKFMKTKDQAIVRHTLNWQINTKETMNI